MVNRCTENCGYTRVLILEELERRWKGTRKGRRGSEGGGGGEERRKAGGKKGRPRRKR